MSLKPALLICAAVLAAGCAIDVPPNDAGCYWVQPIRPSHEDRLTDGTVAQIVALNEVWEEVCGSA